MVAHENLKALGNSAEANRDLYDSTHHPDPDVLEWFDNPAVVGALNLHIEVPEFTSLCPKTGQPDFAKIVIDYIPNERCVESKSLKLYVLGFRNFGEFHEACVTRIGMDLVRLLEPQALIVEGRFTPRGGIPFWPTWSYRRD